MLKRFVRFIKKILDPGQMFESERVIKRDINPEITNPGNQILKPEPQKEEVYGMLKVIKESETGRNLKFQDTVSGKKMTVEEARELVLSGKYPNYLVTKNGVIRSRPGVKNLG